MNDRAATRALRVLLSVVLASVLSLLIGPSSASSAMLAPIPTTSPMPDGASQSPIDIHDCDTVQIEVLPKIRWDYGRSRVEVTDTGSPSEEATIRATLLDDASLELGGKRYALLQFHWHIASEHLRNGKTFPMEMHLVHQADDGELLVVAVWIESGRRNLALAPVFDQLPVPGTPRDATVSLGRLLPRHTTSFRYEGSLTTPPFTEGVNWIVMAEPIEMRPLRSRRSRRCSPRATAENHKPSASGTWSPTWRFTAGAHQVITPIRLTTRIARSREPAPYVVVARGRRSNIRSTSHGPSRAPRPRPGR